MIGHQLLPSGRVGNPPKPPPPLPLVRRKISSSEAHGACPFCAWRRDPTGWRGQPSHCPGLWRAHSLRCLHLPQRTVRPRGLFLLHSCRLKFPSILGLFVRYHIGSRAKKNSVIPEILILFAEAMIEMDTLQAALQPIADGRISGVTANERGVTVVLDVAGLDSEARSQLNNAVCDRTKELTDGAPVRVLETMSG
jgi:hypothetical protein